MEDYNIPYIYNLYPNRGKTPIKKSQGEYLMPIPYHPAWDIRDSSKLDDYFDCHRKYFFAHILGWQTEAHRHDLFFGECWHIAREYMLIHGYNDMLGAYDAFICRYREELPPETDDLYRPKNPDAVTLAIAQFAGNQERKHDLDENEVLFTEISGSVPVDEKRVLYFRMDSVLRNKQQGHIFSWDHKSKGGDFNRQWEEKFHLCIQNGTYTHCLYCMYPEEMEAGLIKGVEFCGTSFRYLKKGGKVNPQGYNIGLHRVPAWKNPSQMNVWLWNTVDLLDDLDRDMERLHHCKASDPVLMAFQQNPGNCSKYWGCLYHDFCMAWSNPLQYCQHPPLGFKEAFWDPREMETTNKMKLEWR